MTMNENEPTPLSQQRIFTPRDALKGAIFNAVTFYLHELDRGMDRALADGLLFSQRVELVDDMLQTMERALASRLRTREFARRERSESLLRRNSEASR